MSAKAATHASGAPAPARDWEVRCARPADAPAIAQAMHELLLELGGTPPGVRAMQDTARAIIDAPAAGLLLVAQAGESLVGVLAASRQVAIHVPGEYALIQDLWVDPAWRSRAVGRELLATLFARARELGLARVEVGLPRESFARFAATEAFYMGNGFEPNGPRMRRVLW